MKAAEDHKRVTPEGKALGVTMAKMADKGQSWLTAEGEADERCKSCAFRLGTVPNGCPQTQLDVYKAVVEKVPFGCHQADKKGDVCHGWFAVTNLIRRMEKIKGPLPIQSAPYEFSPPDEVQS